MRALSTSFFLLIFCISYSQVMVGDTIFNARSGGMQLNASGNRLVTFGSKASDSLGLIYTYDLVDDHWVQMGPSIKGNADYYYNTWLSFDLSDDGKRMIVGRPYEWVGYGYFQLLEEQNGRWIEIKKIIGEQDDYFGHKVTISGDGGTIAVAASAHQGINAARKGAYIKFYHDQNDWEQVGNTIGLNDVWRIYGRIGLSTLGNRAFVTLENDVQFFRFSGSAWRNYGPANNCDSGLSPFDYSNNAEIFVHSCPAFSDIVNNGGKIVFNKLVNGNWEPSLENIFGQTENQKLGRSLNFSSQNNVIAYSNYIMEDSVETLVTDVFKFRNGNWDFINRFYASGFHLSENGKRIAIRKNNKTIIYDLESLVSLKDINLQNNLFEIYPNPNLGNFSISFKELGTGTKHIQIFNSIGQLEFSYGCDDQKFEFTNHNRKLPPGIYIVRVVHGNIFKTTKIIIN